MHNPPKILLITPPFVQWNTPYPATTVLSGHLNNLGYHVFQSDVSIELIHKLYSVNGLKMIFESIDSSSLSASSKLFWKKKQDYLDTISWVIEFLQTGSQTMAHRITSDNFLPKGNRFKSDTDYEWSFGTLGLIDKARYMATMYIEDIGDFIAENISNHFGFNKYAESISSMVNSFEEIYNEVQKPDNLIDIQIKELLEEKITIFTPNIIGISIPFPGNLYSALKIGQYIKRNYHHITVVWGGGFVNTDLRELSAIKVFDFVDYICLDDGEIPLQRIIEFKQNEIEKTQLVRTFYKSNEAVVFADNSENIPINETATPDFSFLPLNKYLSVIEVTNPMHRLWSSGRWNKFTLAHGCYWHQCSFCDTSLDYICRYEPSSATILVDKIEKIIEQTGERGFHFTDEAASPKLLRELSNELIRRKIQISWWTNIRFEKNFDKQLCQQIALSGCIAVSGGLEVASDRILKLINKGISIEQMAKVTNDFTHVGIMVHAYLMYGFPTQTEQETIDSLEVVRQLFELGLIQSAYWHLFTVTTHSDIGQHPEKFKIKIDGPSKVDFAYNDLHHSDLSGIEHFKYGNGLRLALHNYMNGLGYETPVNKWFEFKVCKTQLSSKLIERCLAV